MASGTLNTPRALAWRTLGCAPAFLAARSHRTHASDPVAKRFGPTLSPTRSSKGCGGVRAARSDAAGRLLTSTLVAAATAAVPQASRCESSVAGPDHDRPSVPKATARPKRPTRTGRPSVWAAVRALVDASPRRTPRQAT